MTETPLQALAYFSVLFYRNVYSVRLLLKESILFIYLCLMERSVQEQIILESKEGRSNAYRIGSYVQGIDCGLVSDNNPTFWEANMENDEGPLSESMCSGRESIWPSFQYSDVFCFTRTLSVHMHTQLIGSQGLFYNVKCCKLLYH